ncbi:hypothetical protein IFM89_037919 [Coptis chinensis]|uniref:Germin-like protein n=1 Tax=Coptis chinensis TaxID=261450 RepID=A0A835IGU5_9MAGN|nr:hypothetical protein IFM89_037919 [Coptis chinensis]
MGNFARTQSLLQPMISSSGVNTSNQVGSVVTPAFVAEFPGLNTLGISLGEAFVFPQGLIHFQFNTGKTKAVALASLSSHNPGRVTIANNVFGANPPNLDNVLANAFQLDKKVVDNLQAKRWVDAI